MPQEATGRPDLYRLQVEAMMTRKCALCMLNLEACKHKEMLQSKMAQVSVEAGKSSAGFC